MTRFVGLCIVLSLLALPLAAQTQTAIRVNAGGAGFNDSNGHWWYTDFGYNGGVVSGSAKTATVTGTTNPTLFKSARYDESLSPELQYQFAASKGTYTVNLYFAETTWKAVGKRVFDVQMQGATVIGSLDIFAAVGADRALVKSVLISNTTGTIVIRFVHHPNADNPIISAIEILPSGTSAAASVPTLTSQPVNETVTAGQSAKFSATASGTAPLAYQWQKSGVNISGATSATYTTPATSTTDSGKTFRVLVSNSAGSILSNSATLTVNAAQVAPSITSQLASQTVASGHAATFTVVASGTTPLSYQWQKNGTSISGATGTSYTTPATTSSDNGAKFQVVVSNAVGSVTSSAATLTVTSGSTVASVTVEATNPGLKIPADFGGISTFNILDNCDMMGTASAPNPIYRQLIKNLMFPGQGFILTAEDDDGGAGIPASGGPSAAQVGCAAQLYTDLRSAGYTGFNYWNGVPICTGNQTLANEYATAFLTYMPSGWSPNMVVGNEPDGPCGIAYSTYASRFATWTTGIRSMAGGSATKFMGPQFGGQLPWVDTSKDMNPFIEAEHAVLAAAGQHWYSQNGCTGSPTLTYQLSSAAATNASSIIGSYVSTAHSNGTTFRLSEMNSVDCGGRSGISDTFGSALWVTDALFNLANVGADGVNIFSDEGDYYDLFGFSSTKAPYHISFVRPEYYGFLVFQQATQNGAKLVPVTVSTSSNITAWATIDASNTVRVVVINKDQSASGEVAVNLSGFGNGTLSYLLASSVSATTGVTWAGQTFDGSPDGTIQGSASTTDVTPSSGSYAFSIKPASAVLLTIAP